MSKGAVWLFLLVLSLQVRAAELYESYLSARALGMGNAYTAIVNDSDALFYNPGALCKAEGFTWEILDPLVGVGGYSNVGNVQDIQNAQGNAAFVSALENFFGQRVSADVAMKTSILVPCIEVAGFGSFHMSVTMNNPPYPTMAIRAYADYGEAAGFAFDLVPKAVTLGLAARYDTRYGSEVPLGPGLVADMNTSTLTDQLYNGGYGFGADAGIVATLPTPIKPTFSLVYKNIGYTSFYPVSGAAAPPRIPQELIVGAGASWDTLLLSIRPAVDFKHLDMDNEQIGKKIHAGLEIALPIISVRGGFYQGYYTLGGGVDLGFLRVDAADYGVEMGEYPGQDEDRRYMVQARLEIEFDADFHFDFKKAASRRLKQRR